MTVPHQSEAPVRGRTGFSKIGGLLASVPSVSCPNFRAASLQKIGSKLFCRTGTLATQATLHMMVLIKGAVSQKFHNHNSNTATENWESHRAKRKNNFLEHWTEGDLKKRRN